MATETSTFTFNFNGNVGIAKADHVVANFDRDMNLTQTLPLTTSTLPAPPAAVTPAPATPAAKPEEESSNTLTNRQLVILFTSMLDLSLEPESLNQKALARIMAAVSGKSEMNLRKTIIEVSKNGYETQGARNDLLTVASLLEKLKPKLANNLRQDAEE